MINDIRNNRNNKQLIVTTHNSLIVTSLGLNNVIWITGNEGISLTDIPKPAVDYFVKLDNNNLLQFLLADKCILVEGATEYLLISEFYGVIYPESNLHKDKIDIISCAGLSYKQYLDVAKYTNKKVAVITDNDSKQDNLSYMLEYNKNNQNSRIYMSSDLTNEWTWEASIYHLNKVLIESLLKVQDGAQYLFHKKDYGCYLGKMLNDKVGTAYELLPKIKDIECPKYVKEAFEWIRS
jgi:predicted ATP-dependent endonuclease of OLD family